MNELPERLEILLEQIRDCIGQQAENTGNVYIAIAGVKEELVDLNTTMGMIETYLAQIATRPK